jgi:ubiquinone/menaquinone biosynthesis C-methylase UbiE
MENKEAYKFTNEDAENYDHYLGPILFEPFGQYIASKIGKENISSVLEIACGTGRVTRHLRKALPVDTMLWATDISDDMLNIAKREIDNDGIIFQPEDAQNLSFTNNSFELVICQFGMMFLPDKKKGFDEIFRVLKPGGKFMFFTWDDTLNMPLFKLLVDDLILPHFRDEDTTRFKVPFAMHQPQLLIDCMKNAGFKNVVSNKIMLTSGASVPELVVKAFFRKHPLGKEVLAKDPSAFEAVAGAFQNGIVERFGAEKPSFELSAFLTTGLK